MEYCDQCRAAGEIPYQSTQFNKYYTDYLAKANATMHLNHKPFQKREGSRASTFEVEKHFLRPLPSCSFELATWKVATVGSNYHITVERMNDSVLLNTSSRRWMSDSPDPRWRYSTVEIESAPTPDCTEDSISTAQSRNICHLNTRSMSNGMEGGSSAGPGRWGTIRRPWFKETIPKFV